MKPLNRTLFMKLIFAFCRVAEWVLSKISCYLIHQLLGIWIPIVMKLSPFKQIPSLVFYENVAQIPSGLWLLHSKRSMLSLASSCVVSQIDTPRPTGRSCEVMLRFTSKRNLISLSFAEGMDECIIPVRHKTYFSTKFLPHRDLVPIRIPALLRHEIGLLFL